MKEKINEDFKKFLDALNFEEPHKILVYQHLMEIYSIIKTHKCCSVNAWNSLQFFFPYLVKHLLPQLSKEDFLLELERGWDTLEKYRSKYHGSNSINSKN